MASFTKVLASIRRLAWLSLLLPAALSAQQMPGYTQAAAERERATERDAIGRPAPASAAAHSKALSSETHVAGTPAQARTRDYVIAQMKAWGLETEVRTYDVWMPEPTAAHLWRVDHAAKELPLAEPAVKGDPTSLLPQYPTVNGYSGVGDVTAEVVYANYGLIEDYAHLDSLHVSVKGKIVIARYGRSFRGIKAREAEKHGADARAGRRAARKRDEHGRRSVHAGLSEHRGGKAHSVGSNGGAAHTGDPHRLWQRSRAVARSARHGDPAGVAGRALVQISRRPRAGEGSCNSARRSRDQRIQEDLRHVRDRAWNGLSR